MGYSKTSLHAILPSAMDLRLLGEYVIPIGALVLLLGLEIWEGIVMVAELIKRLIKRALEEG